MKTTLLITCLLFSTAAFAQYYSLPGNYVSSQPMVFEMPEHTAHASFAPMASEKDILGGTGYFFAHGERPASDFPQAEQVSLGAVARELKKQRQNDKKASVVWTNQ